MDTMMKRILILAPLFLSGCVPPTNTERQNDAEELIQDSVLACSDGHVMRVAGSQTGSFAVWGVLNEDGSPRKCTTPKPE